jgi:predicted acyltransferase
MRTMKTSDPDIAANIDSDIVRQTTARKPERLLSIDLLRGLTIAFMILVNDQTGPAPFSQLVHASWNGFTATDLVFPTFVLLVGLSTVLSTAARLARGVSRGELFRHTLRRTLLLLLFGFVVNNFPFFHMATARYYGVLPRIAICYFIVAMLYLLSSGWKDKVVVAVLCLVGYWALMRFVPVPGFGVPTHAIPINDHDANLTAWLDRQIFTAPHLYERTRDPEGLLSTLPAIATALFGLLAGMWLRTRHSNTRKASMLALAGTLLLAGGLLWNLSFPINKKLWTSSFSLFAGGLSLLLLATFIYIVDERRLGLSKINKDPANFSSHPIVYKILLVFGTNAILAYMISELGDNLMGSIHPSRGITLKVATFLAIYRAVPHPTWASLLYSMAFVSLCWLAVLPFYRKRIFLRI